MADLGLSAILGGIGAAVSAIGTLSAGAQQKKRYEYEAKVQQQQADEAQAASQREAADKYRQGRLIESQQRALIAGSGGSLGDASVIDLMGDTRQQVALAAETDIYKGEQQARGYNDAAEVSKINAKNSMQAAWLNAGADLFSGVSNMYSRFGQQQRQTSSASSATAPLYG
jgi:hypothetical protein